MKTYFDVDYHKKFSHSTIINEKGKILKQRRFSNKFNFSIDIMSLFWYFTY